MVVWACEIILKRYGLFSRTIQSDLFSLRGE
jgi:hypothetical protein